MSEPFSTTIKANRAYIHKDLEERLSWLTGNDVITCWILTVDFGRYRILTKSQLEARPWLHELLTQSDETGVIEAEPIESSESALLRFRIRESQVSPKSSPGWRLSLPADLLPHGATENGQTVYLLISQGCLEVWTSECIAANLRKPAGLTG